MENLTQRLTDLQDRLDEEAERWAELDISIDSVHHSNSSLWLVKQQLQAVLNLLLKKELITEDEINLEFKQLMLASLQELRAEYQRTKEAGIASLIGSHEDIVLPSGAKLLDQDGREIKF